MAWLDYITQLYSRNAFTLMEKCVIVPKPRNPLLVSRQRHNIDTAHQHDDNRGTFRIAWHSADLPGAICGVPKGPS